MKQIDSTYSIDESGNVLNTRTNRTLGNDFNSKGYKRVMFNGKHHLVHRLVALYYVPNPDNKPQVNHLDEDILNNHYTNLNWVTNKENSDYSRALHNKPVLSLEDIKFIHNNKGIIKVSQLALMFGLAKITIYKILDNSLYRSLEISNPHPS